MKMLVQRRLVLLVTLPVCAISWSLLGASSGAQPPATATATATATAATAGTAQPGRPAAALGGASSSAGYQCVPLSSLVTAKAGQTGTLSVHLDAFVVTYRAKEARMATGLFAYPGTVTVTEAVRSWALPAPANPKGQYFELGGLCAVLFTLGGQPDVLAEGYWGGAHCCYGPTLYGPASGGYQVLEDLTKPGVGKGLHWNANEGFQPEKIEGTVVLESSDGAFPYTFGCYACTPAPTRLFTVASSGLVDVTTRYPQQVKAEAAAAWSSANQSMGSSADAGSVEGPLAEWAADKCELNEGAQMWQTLEQLQARGKLSAAEQQSFNHKGTFPAQLKAFLLGQGYCRGQL